MVDSNTSPVYKNKGDKKDIENYRPISNLCSSSKTFEKFILKRILEIQDEHKVNITGTSQHWFKKGRSTFTISLTLQTIIAQALDENNWILWSNSDNVKNYILSINLKIHVL